MMIQIENEFAVLAQSLDNWLRQGRLDLVRKEFHSLQLSKIPREHLVLFANLSRRANLPFISLRILNPIIRAKVPIHPPPTPQEYAAYAAGLTRIGALSEASNLLKSLDPTLVPEAWLYQSFICVFRWNYAGAIPCLKKYMSAPSLTAYQKSVAKVNLADAYIDQRNIRQSDKILEELLKETKESDSRLLYGNVLELSAQHSIWKKDYKKAEQYLSEATQYLKETKITTYYGLYLKKWLAVLAVLQGGPDKANEILSVRDQAKELQEWEVVRDCDFYYALLTANKKELTHVIFGTSDGKYRGRIKNFLGAKPILPHSYDWLMFHGTAPDISLKQEIHVYSGCLTDGTAIVKSGQLLHRALKLLSSDFYRPFRVGEIHDKLFPGTYFNPVSTPLQVSQVITRLRRCFRKHQLPLEIETREGSYRLVATGPVCLKVNPHAAKTLAHKGEMDILRRRWAYRAFSAVQAADGLSISKRTLGRLLRMAVETGKLLQIGSGRSTLYRFSQ